MSGREQTQSKIIERVGDAALAGSLVSVLVGIWVDPPVGPRLVWTGVVLAVLAVLAAVLLVHGEEGSDDAPD